MEIATIILTHGNPELTKDTVESIKTWVGNKVLVLVDQAGWSEFQNFKVAPAEMGFLHAHKRSPYRNYALGLQKLYQYWPDSDWFLYCEYDCLFTSSAFKADLDKAENRNAWCVGVDLRRFEFELPLLEQILDQGPIKYSYYFLGCCQFLHSRFLKKIHEIDFIDKLLEQTKDYTKGYFPGYDRWAFEEELWPTIAVHLGGTLYELVCWKGGGTDWQTKMNDPCVFYSGIEHDLWRGRFKLYPMRNSPDIETFDIRPETSIIHPIKSMNAIRLYHSKKRKQAMAIF